MIIRSHGNFQEGRSHGLHGYRQEPERENQCLRRPRLQTVTLVFPASQAVEFFQRCAGARFPVFWEPWKSNSPRIKKRSSRAIESGRLHSEQDAVAGGACFVGRARAAADGILLTLDDAKASLARRGPHYHPGIHAAACPGSEGTRTRAPSR